MYSHGEGNDTVRVLISFCVIHTSWLWCTLEQLMKDLLPSQHPSYRAFCRQFSIAVCVCVCFNVCVPNGLFQLWGEVPNYSPLHNGEVHPILLAGEQVVLNFLLNPTPLFPINEPFPEGGPSLKTTLCWFENGQEWGGGGGDLLLWILDPLLRLLIWREGEGGASSFIMDSRPLFKTPVLIWYDGAGGGGGGGCRMLHWEFQASC